MDRRLTTCEFKSLPHPDRNAAAWLRKHKMDCLVWASHTAYQSARFPAEDDPSDEDVEDGVLEEKENEELRNFYFDEVLDERDYRSDEESSQMSFEKSQDNSDLNVLERALQECMSASLRHRQTSHLLQTRKQIEKENKEREEKNHQQRQEYLMSKGVTKEHAAPLPKDQSENWPTQIENDLAHSRQKLKALREEIRMKRERAAKAFQTPWLKKTEEELHECRLVPGGTI